ncbi:hypothetical protein A2U01_0078578 [Trifolium medium]|uniref:Uncharacterized protein n=1 Tax=Trifolium medium TaxID=97028 RepID=A0A392TA49_9FABA|nr:hypothetical protein [Trifolium medium]
MTSKFGVKRKPETKKIQRRKKRQQEAVLRWIHSKPRIMVPEKQVRTEKEPWVNVYCQKEIRCITEDVPEQTYPPK